MKTLGSASFHPEHVMPVVLILVILTVAVFSAVPSVSAIAQYKLVKHQMCKNAQGGVCKGETHAFDAKDQWAYVCFRIRMEETGTFGGPTVEWYYQSESLDSTYTFETGNVEKGSTWWFWNSLSIRDDRADMRGFWRVEVTGPAGEPLFAEEFTIGPFYQVRIDVGGIPATVSIPIRVDGENYGEIKGGGAKKFGFAPGTSHKLTVQKEIAANEGVRWATQESTWEFTGEGSHSFTYEEQYELAIVIDPTGAVSVAGAGWYSKGATADIGQIPETVDVITGTRFARKTVMLDNQGTSVPPTTITMDKPHTLKIQYQKQHYLKVTSDYGAPKGEGWYDEGTEAKFSVTSPQPEPGFLGQLGGKMAFQAWTEDSAAESPAAGTTMDAPKTVRAVWKPDDTQAYIVLGGIAAAIVVAIVAVLMLRRRGRGPAKAEAPIGPIARAPAPTPPAAPARAPAAPTTRGPVLPPPPPSRAVVAPTQGMKFCISCGAALPASVKFCNKCGSKQ